MLLSHMITWFLEPSLYIEKPQKFLKQFHKISMYIVHLYCYTQILSTCGPFPGKISVELMLFRHSSIEKLSGVRRGVSRSFRLPFCVLSTTLTEGLLRSFERRHAISAMAIENDVNTRCFARPRAEEPRSSPYRSVRGYVTMISSPFVRKLLLRESRLSRKWRFTTLRIRAR